MELVMLAKTVKITVETDTVMLVRQARTVRAWCPLCQAPVEAITLDEAHFPGGDLTVHMREWLETGKLHLWQLPGGPAQICLTSLLLCFELDGLSKIQIVKEST